jgi:hypothetical protein
MLISHGIFVKVTGPIFFTNALTEKPSQINIISMLSSAEIFETWSSSSIISAVMLGVKRIKITHRIGIFNFFFFRNSLIISK